MLTDDDKAFIRANRAEIKQGRTESVVVGYISRSTETVDAIWKEPPSPTGSSAKSVGDYSFDNNDIAVTFDADVDAGTILTVMRKGLRYILTNVDERGLGGLNRYECRAMLAVSNRTITVIYGGVEDGWGVPTPALPDAVLNAYVSEETRTVTNQYGEEAAVQLRIVLEGMAPVNYRDKVRYVNEFDAETERNPVRIAVKRRADGTPLVTEVYV